MRISVRLLGLGASSQVTGSVLQAEEGSTVQDLTAMLPQAVRAQLDQARTLLAVNGRRVDRQMWGGWTLHEGDTVSIMQALAGG